MKSINTRTMSFINNYPRTTRNLALAAIILAFAGGITAQPTLSTAYHFTHTLFRPTTQDYTRSLSSHDKAVIAEFNATSTQAQCHNTAEARVFLKEAQDKVMSAQHDLAASKRLELASIPDGTTTNFQNDDNFTASLDIQSASISYKKNTTKTK